MAENQAITPDLVDAFTTLLGQSSRKTLLKIARSKQAGADADGLARAFLRGMAYGLPHVAEKIIDPSSLAVPGALEKEAVWNVFMQNAHACGMAATLVWISKTIPRERRGARKIAEGAVPHYLSFASMAIHSVTDSYRKLLADTDRKDRKKHFDELVEGLFQCLASQERIPVAEGLYALLEAMLIVREKREEEAALSLDIRLPIAVSWHVLVDAVNQGTILAKANIPAQQELLKQLPGLPTEQIVEELERAGKYVGRGICELGLRDRPTKAPRGLFRKERLWPDHGEAPLALVYGLDWRLPKSREPSAVRLVLLSNQTISIQVQKDPFLEFLLGNWRYVDLYGKSIQIAKTVEHDTARTDDLIPTLYRVARLAYQLGYHNHGATVDLNFRPVKDARKKLQRMREEWDLQDDIPLEGLPLPPSQTGEEPSEPGVRGGFGRLAYALTLQDGLSIWRLSEDGVGLHLHDFGVYVDVQDKQITPTWPQKSREMGWSAGEIQGGRHRAAYVRSLWKSNRKKIVYCVSQDGYIQVFVDGYILQLR